MNSYINSVSLLSYIKEVNVIISVYRSDIKWHCHCRVSHCVTLIVNCDLYFDPAGNEWPAPRLTCYATNWLIDHDDNSNMFPLLTVTFCLLSGYGRERIEMSL